MLNLSEYRRRTASLADLLPWAALIAPGVVLNKDGSFQRSARVRGPDLASATPAEVMALAARVNSVLRRLGSGWTLFAEAERIPVAVYPTSAFPDPVSRLVDAERRAQFEAEGAHYESVVTLTFAWLPPPDETRRASDWLFAGSEDHVTPAQDVLRSFIDRTGRILDLIAAILPEARWLDDSEMLSHLHHGVSGGRQNVRPPEMPMHLDALLATELLTGGIAPRLGSLHLRTLTVIGFPSATFPGILDELNALAFPYRWTTRAICLDKRDAGRLLARIRRQWFAKRKSIGAILKEVLTNEASVLLDSDAANKAADADEALQELGADIAGWAYITTTVTVLDEDPRAADEKLRLVEKVIQGRDFTVIREGLNAVEAWLGSLPGHLYANVRQPPLSTLNLAHILPLSSDWAGPAGDAHLGGPPLFHAQTDGATPFRFALHAGDVGHSFIVGPTGAGKSVLLAFMALQFRRYAGARIVAFDVGGSIRAATLAMGGDWHDLGGSLTARNRDIGLQPLARIDDVAERAWAADWLTGLLAREGVAPSPETKDQLWAALSSLASAPPHERTLTGLAALLQSQSLKRALQPFTVAGPSGHLLDAEGERLGDPDMQAFELEGLIGTPAAPAVLAYLFQRVTSRLDGRPALIIVDEGWLALDDAVFGAQLKEWLKTLRKKNASIVLATQSLADIEASGIAPALIENCLTRIFLANERAAEPQIAAIYRRFGLNERQTEIIARALPRRDYYLQSRQGHRLFELGLSEIALAFCAASSKADHAAITETLRSAGADDFARAWLQRRGLPWAADLLELETAS